MSGREGKVAAFFEDLRLLQEAQPALFQAGEAGVWPAQRKPSVLPENQGDVELGVLQADAPGHGWGRVVLGLLTALADRHGLDLYVRAHADGTDPDAIPQPELEAFYAQAGFRDVGSWDIRDMIRNPRGNALTGVNYEAELLLTRAFHGERVWEEPAGPAL